MQDRPPRWFDRLLCVVGWTLVLLVGHCTTQRVINDMNQPGYGIRSEEVAPIGSPDYPHEP